MRKKFIVALATSLALVNGASVAFADHESGHVTATTSTTSTTVVGESDDTKSTDAKKDALKAERDAYKAKRDAIMETFRISMENARDAFKTAKEAATTDEARKAAEAAYKVAVSNATQIKTDALKALGAKPEKFESRSPLTPEQIAALAKYRQDMITFRAELATFRSKIEALRAAFLEAVKALGPPPVKPEEPNFKS